MFPLQFNQQIPGAAASTAKLAVYSPYDERLLGTIESSDAAALQTALVNAAALFADDSRSLSASERIRILSALANLMIQKMDQLALLAASEGGKPMTDTKAEVLRAIDGVKTCIEVLRTGHGKEIPMNLNAASTGKLAFTHREPIGPVLAFSAFNHPLNLIVHQVVTAIAAGCPVIIKPAETTPLSCFHLVQLLTEAGLPEGWCQPFVVSDITVARQIVSDHRIAFFSFIGSARIGWDLRSMLAPGVRCALEHGGAAPVLVCADADLKKAVPKIIKGGMYHAGQVCVSVQRVFVARERLSELQSALVNGCQNLVVGDPLLEETQIGPLIRSDALPRLQGWVDDAVADGAELLCGGRSLANNCYAPTVLLNPPIDAAVSCQEVFGPILCLYPFDSIEEAIALANRLPFSFQAALFTESLDTAMLGLRRLKAQAVLVNEHTAFRVDWMPFGAGQHSGLGIGGIAYTMQDLQKEKLLVIHSAALNNWA
ncbi:MAG: aldehyde dehydrogenase family protein [Leptospiraceae bacterium]|nr:aldehyde dehydrogenase family protein [Leptospiraceae bacterium]